MKSHSDQLRWSTVIELEIIEAKTENDFETQSVYGYIYYQSFNYNLTDEQPVEHTEDTEKPKLKKKISKRSSKLKQTDIVQPVSIVNEIFYRIVLMIFFIVNCQLTVKKSSPAIYLWMRLSILHYIHQFY